MDGEQTIYKDGAPVPYRHPGGIVESFIFRDGLSIPAGVTVHFEVEKDGEWKRDPFVKWEAGQEDELRSFSLECGLVRAVTEGGVLPNGMEVRF